MVCVERVVEDPFHSLRGQFPPSPCMETCQTTIERIGSVFPPKLSGKTFHRGSADPPLAPLVTDLCWFTALWVLMSDGRCRGLVGRFGLVCEPSFVCVTADAIVCDFCLHIHLVFFLFRTCAPENINHQKQLWI